MKGHYKVVFTFCHQKVTKTVEGERTPRRL
ncbi:MAG: hypothetical protein ACD_18C00067G0012, partial [uncultured bacterium]